MGSFFAGLKQCFDFSFLFSGKQELKWSTHFALGHIEMLLGSSAVTVLTRIREMFLR